MGDPILQALREASDELGKKRKQSKYDKYWTREGYPNKKECPDHVHWIIKLIDNERIARGFTIEQFSEKLNLNNRKWSRYRNGRAMLPGLRKLERALDQFGLELAVVPKGIDLEPRIRVKDPK